jgi:uncharacterized protein YecT (DUF1311 family)
MNALRALLIGLAIALSPGAGHAQSPRLPSPPAHPPGAAPPLLARTPDPAAPDAALMSQCLVDAKDHPLACLGRVQKPCLETDAGQTTAGAMQCSDRERLVWASRSAAAVEAVRKKLLPERFEYFDAAEAAWTAYKDAACRYEASAYLGGSLAKVVAADCLLSETANHAVDLEAEARGQDE